jgi:hypothetical protein
VTNRPLITWPIVVVALGCALVLTIIPVFWIDLFGAKLLAAPGMVLSTVVGANDRWGLPAAVPYFIGGVACWTLFIVVACALVRSRVRLRTEPKNG